MTELKKLARRAAKWLYEYDPYSCLIPSERYKNALESIEEDPQTIADFIAESIEDLDDKSLVKSGKILVEDLEALTR